MVHFLLLILTIGFYTCYLIGGLLGLVSAIISDDALVDFDCASGDGVKVFLFKTITVENLEVD